MQYYLQPQRVSIAAGTIDMSTGTLPQPNEHIFLAEKAPWFQLPDDGLARFEKFGDLEERKHVQELGKKGS